MVKNKISNQELRKDVLGAAISKKEGYNEEFWDNPKKPLSKEEYAGIGVYSDKTVASRCSSKEDNHDGWNRFKEGLALETNPIKFNAVEYMEGLKQ